MRDQKTELARQRIAKAKEILDEVRDLFVNAVPVLWDMNRDDIKLAIEAAVEAAQEKQEESESPVEAKISLPITCKWSLYRREISFEMPVTIKRVAKVEKELEDPNQPQLPGVSNDTARAFAHGLEKRELAAKILTLEKDNPPLHRAALALMEEEGLSYVDALTELARRNRDVGGPNA